MGCTDWCDAFMYCQWAGKRLCGRIGGGPNTEDAVADAAADEWYNACSQGGKTVYSNGDDWRPEACVSSEYVEAKSAATGEEVKAPRPPREASECRGSAAPYDGIYDLSGNLPEWVNTPYTDPTDGRTGFFVFRGQHLDSAEDGLRCDTVGAGVPDDIQSLVGIRCCRD